MKAAVHNRYGPPEVLSVIELPTPAPGPGEILVRVRAGTVCAPDWRFRSATPGLIRIVAGLFHPARNRVLGMDFAGEVAGVGAGVTRWRPGDAVFGSAGMRMGGHAEFLVVKDGPSVQRAPAGFSAAEAAAIPYAGVTALHFLRAARLQPGAHVLVHGASGGVGTAMVQIARAFGARVTAVTSGRNRELVLGLGAERAVDYQTQDFSAEGPIYDVVADVVGKAGLAASLRAVRDRGAILHVAPEPGDALAALWAGKARGVRIIGGVALARDGDMAQLAGWAEAGCLRPPIERAFELDEIVQAHRLSQSGRKRGHVAVVMG